MSPPYIRSTTLDQLDPTLSSNFLALTAMNMGMEVSSFLAQSSICHLRLEVKGFLEHVQSFYIEAAVQIKQRFPIDDHILKSLIFLNPDTINATSADEVIKLASKFPNIIPVSERRKLDDEWRELTLVICPTSQQTTTARIALLSGEK